jgi:proteasome lid subunit RPN8/RPN11
MNLPKETLDLIADIAVQLPAEEVGGVICRREGLVSVCQIKNTCTRPADGYMPAPDKLWPMLAEDEVISYWHSHVNGKQDFSPSDLNSMYASGLPSLLYNVLFGSFDYRSPVNTNQPYLGRQWEFAWTDCYTIIRDFYQRELAIDLPAPKHNGNPTPWKDSGWNDALHLLPSHFDKLALDPATDSAQAQPYDILLFHGAGGRNPSHLGLLLPTTQGFQMLHHPYQRYSELTPRINEQTIHSIWRSKCKLSQSSCLEYWAIGMGAATSCGQIDLVKHSAT